jgi:hypothetical protein
MDFLNAEVMGLIYICGVEHISGISLAPMAPSLIGTPQYDISNAKNHSRPMSDALTR